MRFAFALGLLSGLIAGTALAQAVTPAAVNGMQYLTVSPTLSNYQKYPFRADINGNLQVNCITGCSGGGGGSNVTIVGPLGQALMAASIPVVLASDQSTITITGAVSVSNFPATQPVSGTVTALQGTSPWVTSGTSTVSGTVAATQSGTWNLTNISGTISLPTGAATSALQSTINTTLGSPFQAGGSIGNTAFGITGAIPAGSNIIGNVRIDQTTPGTTNGVVVNSSALPTGAASSTATPYLVSPGTSNNGLYATALTLLSTELNSLVTSGGVISTGVVVSSVGGASGVFSNSNTAQVISSPLVLTVGAIGSSVSAGGNVACWFLPTADGTNYELTTSVPARSPDAVFAFQNRTYAAGEVLFNQGRWANIPALKFKVLCQNNTGQSLAASGNTVALAPTATQHQ